MSFDVAVIVPCLNGQQYLGACLESVLAQDFGGTLHVIVADDGSTDASAAIAARYAPRVEWFECPEGAQHGCGAARNRGIAASLSTYIALIDADDLWFPNHISQLVSALESDPATAMACDAGTYVDENGQLFGSIYKELNGSDIQPETILLDCFTDPSGVVVRRSTYDVVGGFAQSPELLYVEDHDLWLRLAERYRCVYVPRRGYAYRLHSGQVSHNPLMWANAFNVLKHAANRYPYGSRIVRQRRAVLYYRTGELGFKRRNYLGAALNLASAALLDPRRATREVVRHLTGRRRTIKKPDRGPAFPSSP